MVVQDILSAAFNPGTVGFGIAVWNVVKPFDDPTPGQESDQWVIHWFVYDQWFNENSDTFNYPSKDTLRIPDNPMARLRNTLNIGSDYAYSGDEDVILQYEEYGADPTGLARLSMDEFNDFISGTFIVDGHVTGIYLRDDWLRKILLTGRIPKEASMYAKWFQYRERID